MSLRHQIYNRLITNDFKIRIRLILKFAFAQLNLEASGRYQRARGNSCVGKSAKSARSACKTYLSAWGRGLKSDEE